MDWKIDYHSDWIVMEKGLFKVHINKYTGDVSLFEYQGKSGFKLAHEIAKGNIGVHNDEDQIRKANAWASWHA